MCLFKIFRDLSTEPQPILDGRDFEQGHLQGEKAHKSDNEDGHDLARHRALGPWRAALTAWDRSSPARGKCSINRINILGSLGGKPLAALRDLTYLHMNAFCLCFLETFRCI